MHHRYGIEVLARYVPPRSAKDCRGYTLQIRNPFCDGSVMRAIVDADEFDEQAR